MQLILRERATLLQKVETLLEIFERLLPALVLEVGGLLLDLQKCLFQCNRLQCAR